MKKDAQFDLAIAKLADKTHHFAFELDRAFFEQFDQQLIPDGNLHADVTLHKTDRLLTLDFAIKGTVRLICDRSLDEYDQPLDIQEQLLVRYGDREVELDDNVLQITQDTQTLPIAQHLFDYIGLALPMKKLHPRFQNEPDENPEAETKLIFTTRQEGDDEDDDNDGIDPRWNALKNLN
ncbi:DUF177 domain-containing protein [Hymenobacter lutimineralis]|uniref:DUF177 domain-containing protein n=1 Tax=Hymenobacter lutimineralis TaxID=2606448 RepID=A0A5D6UTK3_9BACT|nr:MULTISPECIES: DUF177 domain-containing protein [Hymenobacter]QIX63124.1 DUF177 domain-containing protein [Hymenobacter sp. BT18]TYZ05962.1 DUF177 domain-containing protein [Hymenobacter lutimineralis]